MKSNLIFLAITFFVSSCSKVYTCECKTYVNGSYNGQSAKLVIKGGTITDAEKSCASNSTVYITSKIICEIQ